ncbi:GNAT family N-acetyltransferase [Natronorubrum sp. JWXQ-INN-674]|uniref:GNAT family N-acetyltransferase n=1 Tax=Natronorubrum halalkaliphilum TaxID=2691917 RepID=A0A6B0VN89_9EURY|nr:GNAT family N-acetyltransferase [Natronorubrum halalkaliphilum]MXV63060.1 GNAT family N-acetyltransferase [Natronorubrum halalkaliphilum]
MARTVRQATPEAATTVREIARESWHAAYDGFLGAERVSVITDDWYSVEGLEASIADATDRNDATFSLALSEPLDSPEGRTVEGFAHASAPDDDSVASLHRLYVRPSAWGDGAGTALLERVETDLQPACDRLRLTVFADNEIGVSFYDSSGFERIDIRERDLGDGLEEYVYEKPL